LLLLSKLEKLMRKIQSGDNVKVHYTGKLEDGSIFDTSLAEGREPLETTLGQGQLIKGFEAGLMDMSEGEKKTIEIESADAYGEHNPEMINEIPRAQVPEGVQAGEMLQGMGPMGPVNVKVVEVKEETVVLDANHPLAGKKLIFDLEVVSIS
jgi:FKBP-type peptidyl-prolyl cis-trans isomerase SlpA